MSTGIIRAPRRPDGWTPPGPAPRGDGGDPALLPAADEDLCLLSGDWRILQKLRGNRWSLDDLVTAWVATRGLDPGAPRRCLDLGCGVGSVLLMVAWRLPGATSLGVEAQDVSMSLARRSIRYNGVEDRVRVEHGDFRDEGRVEAGAWDLVTGTPPYFPPGTGVESGRVQCAPARFEHRGGVEDYATAAARALSPDGAFAMVAGGLEVERAMAAVTAAGMSLRAVWRVLPKAGRPPRVAVVVGSRREGPTDERELVVRRDDDQWTEAFRTVRAEMGLPPDPPRRP